MAEELPPVPAENPDRGNLSSVEAGKRFELMFKNFEVAAEELMATNPKLHAELVGKATPFIARHVGAAFPLMSIKDQEEILQFLDAARWNARGGKE